MKWRRRGERGFTLVELLIALAIIAVLAAVVFPNITGMFGRGSKQSFSTEQKTIQHAVTLFKFDVHRGSGSPWGAAIEGHYYPTKDGQPAADNPAALLAAAGSDQHYFDGGANGTIWMGLLVNSPKDGTTGNDSPDTVHPQGNEMGPYLNEMPKSASVNNGGGSASGTYTWVICRDGNMYGVYWDGIVWKEGFSGKYP